MIDRIPYKQWISTQLSIASHTGEIEFNGVRYVVEFGTNDLVRADGLTIKQRLVNELKRRNMYEAAKHSGLLDEQHEGDTNGQKETR